MAVSIPRLKKSDALAKEFSVAEATISAVLKELQQMELVYLDTAGLWNVTGKFLHLRKSSPFFSINHFNWRLKAIQNLQQTPNAGIHYTSVFTISEKDRFFLEEEFRKIIESVHRTVSDSTDEELSAIAIDFYK